MYLGRLVVRDRIAGTLMRQVKVVYDDGSGNTRHARLFHCHVSNAVCYFDDEHGELALIVPISRIYYIEYL